MSIKMRGIIEKIVAVVLVIVLSIGLIAMINFGVNEYKQSAIRHAEYQMRKAEYIENLQQIADGLTDWTVAYLNATHGN